MRFTTFINDVVEKVAKDQRCYDKMRSFSHENFKDGWEIWLQCEAFSILPDSRQYEYSRGNKYPYPFDGKKCDFLLKRDKVSLWLELKVLLKQDMNDLIARFADDLNKIDAIKPAYETNSIGAFAVVPLGAPDLFSERIKTRFREKSKVEINDIRFLAVEPGAANIEGTYNSSHDVKNSRVVILYYLKL